MDRFHFFLNYRFVMKTTTKKRKTKRSFSKTTVFKKLVVSLTIVNDKPSLTSVNNDPSLTIVNDDPSLTIVNEERGNRPEGHRYLSLSSFKENIKKFLLPHNFFQYVRQLQPFVNDR